MKRHIVRGPTALLVSILMVLMGYATAQSTQFGFVTDSESAVHRFADLSIVEEAHSHLIRTAHGVAMELITSELAPDSIYTVWWVVFNNPGACSPEPEGDPGVPMCNEDDILNAGGEMELNPLARISILWATGGISGADGSGAFSAYLPVGRTPGEVLAGSGLENAGNAEVHLVVRSHGGADLARLYEQLSSFEMTCETCEDMQFAVHAPSE